MTDRVFEDARSWEVSSRGDGVEVYVLNDGNVNITTEESSGFANYGNINFIITSEEATALKEFLIRKGY